MGGGPDGAFNGCRWLGSSRVITLQDQTAFGWRRSGLLGRFAVRGGQMKRRWTKLREWLS